MTSSATTRFTGFPAGGLEFLEGLAHDNTREYFDAHRAVYETALLRPAKEFVVALGAELQARVSPEIRAEPRVNGSILRINRDTRFSIDKRPYKEHLDFWFWAGEGPSREHAGLAVRLRPGTVGLGAGMHHLEAPVLAAYRAAVADDRTGTALQEAIARATSLRGASIGEPAYKRVPRGFPAEHPRADLLRRAGLFVGGEWKLPRAASGPSFVGWVADRLEQMAPVERWMTGVLEGARAGSGAS
jgi:uncharacterized protein (TIGR02453 family)